MCCLLPDWALHLKDYAVHRPWLSEYIDVLRQAVDEQDLFKCLATLARELGFEHCSYGMRSPLPLGAPQFSLFSDYPDIWSQRYVERNYFSIDPTVHHALTQSTPLIWSAESPMAHPEFWEEAQQHQLKHGWCMPSRGQFGTVGLLTFVRSGELITETELDAKESRMILLTQVAHSAMSERLAPKQMTECSSRLTPREREVLQWMAAGKTYIETGSILGIDDRTVKFHLKNAMTKLHAINKTQAAFKATLLGIL